MPKIKKYFDNELLERIHKLIKDGTIDNFKRADILSSWLGRYGFKEAGCGTNRIAYEKNGYIFKIAINSKGITGNHSEYNLSDQLQPYVTECYDNNGLILIAEKVTVMDRSDTKYYEDKMYKILKKISHTFILSDIGLRSFLNWGINSEGDPIILDYAYLRPITSNMNFNCRKKGCDGRLRYKDDFSAFECDVCRKEHSIVDVAGDNLNKGKYDNMIEDLINTDFGEAVNDLKQAEQANNWEDKSQDKGENNMNKKDITTIGEAIKAKVKVHQGNNMMNETDKQAIQKTRKTVVDDLKNYRKLADY